jgi:UDP-N-acetylmuramoyl-tripeptide--D-alanyl-D-alanine ligase
VAAHLGLDLDLVAGAMAAVQVPGGRGELLQVGRLTILNDSYNANPMSFRSVMATAEGLRVGRRLVFVAGTMRELGPEAPALHRSVAEGLVALGPDLLAAVGEFVPALAPWREALGDRLLTAADAAELAPRLAERLRGDELVVLKASRGVALERILPAISSRATPVEA